MAEGKIVLRREGQEVSLKVSQNLTLEIEAEKKDEKRKGVRHSLELEIEWFEEGAPSQE